MATNEHVIVFTKDRYSPEEVMNIVRNAVREALNGKRVRFA